MGFFFFHTKLQEKNSEFWGSQNDQGDMEPWKPKYYLILVPPHPILMWKFPAEDGKLQSHLFAMLS